MNGNSDTKRQTSIIKKLQILESHPPAYMSSRPIQFNSIQFISGNVAHKTNRQHRDRQKHRKYNKNRK